jgi:hypothetical protein
MKQAWTSIITDDGFSLGLATEGIRGYMRTSAWFPTYDEATATADRMNQQDGITVLQAHRIVASSIKGGKWPNMVV